MIKKTNLIQLTGFIFLLLLMPLDIISAQDAQQRPVDQTLLPEIDPQDIEIRGQFQARFPGLRRQPILGFNPKPRVFQIDPNRTPFIESEEAIAANLPIGQLARPEAPQYMPLTYADPKRAFGRFGLGSYITPEADLYVIQRLGDAQWVSGNINHRSTNGHLEGQESAFRQFDADLRSYQRLSQKNTLKLRAGFTSNFNYLPPDRTDVGTIQGSEVRSADSGFRIGGDFERNRNSLAGWSLSSNLYLNQFKLENLNNFNAENTAEEWGVNVGSRYSWLGSRVEEVLGVELDVNVGGIETTATSNGPDSWSMTRAAATYDRNLNYQTDVSIAFGAAFVTDAVNDPTFYLTPKIEVEHSLFRNLAVRGQISGMPVHQSLRTSKAENRYSDLQIPVEKQYHLTYLAEVIIEPLNGTKVTGGVQYRDMNNYRYYERAEDPVTVGFGPYRALYRDASLFRVYGTATQELSPEKLWVGVSAYWQRPRLSGNDKIPYTESIGLNGSVSYRPLASLLVEGWGDFSGQRFNPIGEDLSSYFTLGAKFELSITERIGVYGKLLNITDREYEIWQGYTERGFQGYIGITTIF